MSDPEQTPAETSAPVTGTGKLRARLRQRQAAETVPVATNPLGEPVASPKLGDPNAEVEEDDRSARAPAMTKAVKQNREDEDRSIVDWLTALEADAPIRVSVTRKEPTEVFDPLTNTRKNVAGHIRTYERPVSEEELQKNHGGGLFTLKVTKRDYRGSYAYFGSRTLQVNGDPRIDDVPRSQIPAKDPTAPSAIDSPIMSKIVDNLLNDRNKPAPDLTGHIATAMQPIIESNRRLEQSLDRKDREMSEMRERMYEGTKVDPNATTFQQKLLDKMIDGDSARITALRIQFESELRQAKDAANENEKRVRDQADRDREYLHRSHEREVDNLKHSHQREVDNLKSTYDIKMAALEQSFALQKSTMESEGRRNERELDQLRIEVKELRNKKDPSLKEKIAEIATFKELVGDLGDGEDEKKSGFVRFLEGAAQSEVIGGFAQRVMSGAAGAAQALPPPPPVVQAQVQPRRRAGGPRLIRDRRNGQVYATDGNKAIPVQRKQQVAAPVPQPPAPPPPIVLDEQGVPIPQPEPIAPPVVEMVPEVEVPIPYLEPSIVAGAVTYMENAFGNNVDPMTFVESVRAFIPKEVVAAIGAMGVENFLTKVGGLEAGISPLMGQAGKNWSRRVSRILLGE